MKNETKQTIRRVGFVLFIIYMLILIYLLFFVEEYGRVAQAEQAYRYNFTPFVEIHRFWKYRDQLGTFALLTNIGGNVVGFMPYGFILPVITRRRRSGFLVILSGFCISLTVEVIQLATKVGSFDVDDLILNTLGVALGYLLFYICNALRRIYYGKKI